MQCGAQCLGDVGWKAFVTVNAVLDNFSTAVDHPIGPSVTTWQYI